MIPPKAAPAPDSEAGEARLNCLRLHGCARVARSTPTVSLTARLSWQYKARSHSSASRSALDFGQHLATRRSDVWKPRLSAKAACPPSSSETKAPTSTWPRLSFCHRFCPPLTLIQHTQSLANIVNTILAFSTDRFLQQPIFGFSPESKHSPIIVFSAL